MTTGRVLDTSAIVPVATGVTEYARALRATAADQDIILAVPAAALAAAWTTAAPAARLFVDLMLDWSIIRVDPLDASAARAVATVLGSPRRGPHAPLDLGHVVSSARARGWPVITRHAAPLLALAADLDVRALPA